MRISTTRIVLLIMALTVCVGFFFGRLDSKDFFALASMVFSFYYANKGYASKNIDESK